MGKEEPLSIAGRRINEYSHYGHQFKFSSKKKIKLELPYDPGIPFQGRHPKNPISYHRDISISMFIVALFFFTIAQQQNQHRHLSMDKWVVKMWYIHKVEYYSALKKNKIMKFAEKRTNSKYLILYYEFDLNSERKSRSYIQILVFKHICKQL